MLYENRPAGAVLEMIRTPVDYRRATVRLWPARTFTVLPLRRSLTPTTPRLTRTTARSQKSSVIQIVPRTVAAANLPRVRKRPWPLPNSERTGLRRAECEANGSTRRGVCRHAANEAPRSLRSVTGWVDLGR